MSNFNLIPIDTLSVLNYYSKYIARGPKFPLANSTDVNTIEPSEKWRFPIVQTHLSDSGYGAEVNKVTFIYQANGNVQKVELIGSFGSFYEPISMQRLIYENNPSQLFAVSIILPIGQSFYYKFKIDDQPILDPINPQTTTFANGKKWSFFFTDYYNFTNEFQEWELNLLNRLVDQIILFRTEESQNFINRFYISLPKNDKLKTPIYKLDDSVGEVNYITNIVAREERHHLENYKICLEIIDKVLRLKNPFVESWDVSSELIDELYNDIAYGNVPGWDYSRYQDPKYFLTILRRHTISGAFSHPRYGGNIGGAGWNYLKEKFPIKDDKGQIVGNYFNWDLSIESPIGQNSDYKG